MHQIVNILRGVGSKRYKYLRDRKSIKVWNSFLEKAQRSPNLLLILEEINEVLDA
jgi:hypothetical protein